jgi:hypothetical protein
MVDTLNPTEVARVKNSENALILYTCKYSGKARTAVFASEQTEKSSQNL